MSDLINVYNAIIQLNAVIKQAEDRKLAKDLIKIVAMLQNAQNAATLRVAREKVSSVR